MNFKQKTQTHINNEAAFAKLEQYVSMIEETNKVMNLTGFKGDKLWEEGIYESILLLERSFNNDDGSMLDIGAGAGFPSIPYIIVHPEKELTIYEPIGKRVKFLKEVSDALGLMVDVQQIRVEDSKELDKFDFITARAVVDLKVLMEVSYHVGKQNASFAFIKGKRAKNEIHESRFNSNIFNVVPKIIEVVIGEKQNNIITYKKTKPTPKGYPRLWSVIKRG